jgi:beta-N-acetylhexosaminidase
VAAGAVVVASAVAAWLLVDRGDPGMSVPAAKATAVRPLRRAGRPATPQRPQAAAAPSLSREQLAGQRIVYAYAGLRPPPSLLAVIRAGEAGGVILFTPNISSARQIRVVIARLQRAALASPVHATLLIMTDQEGGQVRRLAGAPVASEKQVGEQSGAVGAAAAAGTGAGRNLASAGINVNLAPVLDVYRSPGNFIDEFQRSYASEPRKVASLGAAFVAAQQLQGVAATGKHFPGLGAAGRAQNTDLGPVTLGVPLGTLRSVDESPYRAAIAAGLDLVMTSWATYPALDPRRPAGLSPAVIQRELRARLGFRGVTITDGIDAAAVRPFGGLGRRGVLAAAAGADLILCATTNPDRNTPQEGVTVLRALTAALSDHQLGLASAAQAAGRVLSLRHRLAPAG